jgi:carbamoyl-phosphate synthase large subunit
VHEVLIEESVLGWKEFELEVMRDLADNCIIVCSIENFDPMGVHTGDSITVAPGADPHRPRIPDDARRRHALPARNRRRYRRLQRAVRHQSARRAHGDHRDEPARVAQLRAGLQGHRLPIAKIAAKLAVGYRLDEIRNDITRKTPACFEPTIDYVVAKIPKWAFEKFPGADPRWARR